MSQVLFEGQVRTWLVGLGRSPVSDCPDGHGESATVVIAYLARVKPHWHRSGGSLIHSMLMTSPWPTMDGFAQPREGSSE
jgi:hypothetical protein